MDTTLPVTLCDAVGWRRAGVGPGLKAPRGP